MGALARGIGEEHGSGRQGLREAVRDGAAGVVVVDVRSPGEYASAHIRGSYNVPLDALSEVAPRLGRLNGETVALVCRTGLRAAQAETILRSSGLDLTRVLAGGIDGWEAAGLPLERGRGTWSIERQVRRNGGAPGYAVVGPWTEVHVYLRVWLRHTGLISALAIHVARSRRDRRR